MLNNNFIKSFVALSLFSLPTYSYCQLSIDSLRQIAIAQFRKDLVSHEEKRKIKRYAITPNAKLIYKKSEELFKGYFSDYKIFLITFTREGQHSGSEFATPQVYAINGGGKMLNIKKAKSFFKFVNSSDKPLTNLDKCYLYLYLFEHIFKSDQLSVTPPQFYANDINTQSVLYNLFPATKILFEPMSHYGDGDVFPLRTSLSLSKISDDIKRSIKTNIIIYSYQYRLPQKYHKKKHDITYRYSFIFDEKNNLNEVNRKCFK